MFTTLFAELSILMMRASFISFLLELGFILMVIFSVIGLIATIRFFIKRAKNKKNRDPYKEWIKTGKM